MQPSLAIMPPRFTLEVPPEQVEIVERLCVYESADHVHRAMLHACNFIEHEVKAEHYGKPHVQAAAFLLLQEFAYYRGGAQASRLRKPKCLQEVLTLIEPYRKGYFRYG